MPRRVVLALLSATLLTGLAGCISPQELRREDEAACASFGFKPDTSDFATCLQRESLARRYESGLYDFGWYGGPGWYPPPPYMMH